jgi:hypothetical protein
MYLDNITKKNYLPEFLFHIIVVQLIFVVLSSLINIKENYNAYISDTKLTKVYINLPLTLVSTSAHFPR